MLVRREPELALVDLGDLPKTGLEVTVRLVLYTAVFDESREVMQAIVALNPSKVVDITVESVGTCGLKLVA